MDFSEYLTDRPVVTNSYFLANWVQNGTPENTELFDVLARRTRRPDHTFLLSAGAHDLSDISGDEEQGISDSSLPVRFRKKCAEGLARYGYNHTVLDSTGLLPEQVHGKIMQVLRKGNLTKTGTE